MLTKLNRAIYGGFLFRGSQGIAVVAAVIIILLVVVTCVNVGGRYSPWAGPWLMSVIDVSELLMAMVSVSAVAYCWYVGGHLRIGLLRDHASPKIKAVLDTVAASMFLIWIAAIVYSVGGLAIGSLAYSAGTITVGIPLAPFQIFFTIVMAHFILVLLRSCIGLVAKASGRHVEHEGLY